MINEEIVHGFYFWHGEFSDIVPTGFGRFVSGGVITYEDVTALPETNPASWTV